MELHSVDRSKIKLAKVLVKCINILCTQLDRPRSKQHFKDSLQTMQLFENMLYRLRESNDMFSKEEYIAQLHIIYKLMNSVLVHQADKT